MRAPDEVKDANVIFPDSNNPAEILWNLIIRPPRAKYRMDQLGPTHFRVQRSTFVRRSDLELRNPRGHALQCSFFEPLSQSQWEQSRAQRFREAEATPAAGTSRSAAFSTAFAPAAATAEASSPAVAAAAAATAETVAVAEAAAVGSGTASAGDFEGASPTLPRGSQTPQFVAPPTDDGDGDGPSVNAMSPVPVGCTAIPGSALKPSIKEPLPCVVFLHGNSSCRLEALPLVTLLLPLNISLFCFDFSGCGMSQGSYISLGWFEREDLAICIDYLRSLGCVSRIALWGRSMGAFTALLHADRDPTIAGLVLDSPFVSLTVLAEELARSFAKVPAWMVRAVLPVVRSIIQAKASFDIQDLEAVQHVGRSFSPALFVAATGDDFILPHHAQELCQAYQGEKEIHMVSGDHNSARPEACRRKAALFLCRAFHDERLDRLLEMHVSGLYDIFAGAGKLQTDLDANPVSSDEGAYLCRQMRIFPALRLMRLMHQRRCRRPFVAKTDLRLQQDNSEAGFFLRLDPLVVDGRSECSVPRYLVITVSAQALIVSRVCDDALETLAAAGGLPVKQVSTLMVDMDEAGCLKVHLGTQLLLDVPCGDLFREEVTLWLMLLHGLIQCGPVLMEDSEATIRENLGDLVLRQRHIGSSGNHVSGSQPARCPDGDQPVTPTVDGALPSFHISGTSTATSPGVAPASTAVGSGLTAPNPAGGGVGALEVGGSGGGGGPADAHEGRGAQDAQDCGFILRECMARPEALIGWKILVHAHGEGIIVGVKRRRGRSTQHVILCTDVDGHDAAGSAFGCFGGKKSCLQPGCFSTIMLSRKEWHKTCHRGLSFMPLNREY